MGIIPIMWEFFHTSFCLLNQIPSYETMVNQLDEIDGQVNPIDQFLQDPNNTQMVDKIIESHKDLIFVNMFSQGMIITSLVTLVTASP